jgi:S-adenosylmethionine decarboxylase
LIKKNQKKKKKKKKLQKKTKKQKKKTTTNKKKKKRTSTMCDSFEGPEKKLEIEFSILHDHPSANQATLRSVPRAQLDEICALVHCTILSHTANEFFDSYVLSESSLFVYPHKVLIKTCGTTTLLACVDMLLAVAANIGLRPASVYYSRQRFIFPEKQPFPHTSFEHETARLNALFANGESHCLGDQQGDHWFIFHADLVPEKPVALRNDRTIEVMMRDLDPIIMRLFYLATYECDAARSATRSSPRLAPPVPSPSACSPPRRAPPPPASSRPRWRASAFAR